MMKYFDVFNGDADGICSLIQLRLANPVKSTLITGIKRDIQLLQQVNAQSGDKVCVLDVSMSKNATSLMQLLNAGVSVFYADHHVSGEIPDHPNLQAFINTSADTCTALIINNYLKNAYKAWAITAAFGDNLSTTAIALGKQAGFSSTQIKKLEALGIYINYNGYGADIDDLFYHPAELYQLLGVYQTPFEFFEVNTEIFEKLETGFKQDMSKAQNLKPTNQTNTTAAFILPNEQWARRVSGVFSNDLANQNPDRAHAVLTEKADSSYLVSVRAPLNRKTGADELVSQFPTGGGRKAAAGINVLPPELLETFIKKFQKQYA